jgi:hypothetical protein
MASLSSRIKTPGDDIIRSQKSNSLPHGSKIELPKSTMEFTSLAI